MSHMLTAEYSALQSQTSRVISRISSDLALTQNCRRFSVLLDKVLFYQNKLKRGKNMHDLYDTACELRYMWCRRKSLCNI